MVHKIYLASSWSNESQPNMVTVLRGWGHSVYDFRNPKPGDSGFNWDAIDPQWKDWDMDSYREALWSPIAESGFQNDCAALLNCEVVVLLLPSGASAHTEAAWHCGRGRPVIVHSFEKCQPELMYKLFNAITGNNLELKEVLDLPLGQLGQKFLAHNGPFV